MENMPVTLLCDSLFAIDSCVAMLIFHFRWFMVFVLPVQHAFLKQFYGSVTKSDYTTMRLGFIMVSSSV